MAIMRTRQLRMPSKQMLPHVVTKVQARAAAPRGHTLIVKAESGDNTVRMSLDLYSALQVNPAASRSTLTSNFKRLHDTPPSPEYSDDTKGSREMILKLAYDNLTDVTARHAYDRQVANGEGQIDIDFHDVPGALSLLQEAGHFENVIRLGSQLLDGNTCGSAVSADLALVIAQAHCDTAAALAERDEVAAFQSMVTALQTLTKHSAAPRLQSEISDALEDMKPTVLLKMIAEPLGPDSAELRQRGLQLLREVLVGEGATWTAIQRDEYLTVARPHMTADEQIKLWEWQQQAGRPALSEVQDAALAFLAEGVRRRWPPHVAKAEKMLLRLVEDAKSASAEELAPFDGAVDVSVELAVCRLLLGDAVAAYRILAEEGCSEVRGLIEELAGGSGDRLLGVCGLIHRVLVEVQLPAFRCCQDINAPLTHWFDSRLVTAYLQAADVWRLLQINNLRAMAGRSMSAVAGKTHSAAGATGQAVQYRTSALTAQPALESSGNGTGSNAGHSTPSSSSPALEITQGSRAGIAFNTGGLGAGGWTRRANSSSSSNDSSDLMTPTLQSPYKIDRAGGQLSTEDDREYILASGSVAEATQRGGGRLAADGETSEDALPAMTGGRSPLGLMKLAGEQEMWAPLECRKRLRFRSIVAVALAGGLAAVATVAAVSSRKGRPALPPSDGITAPVDSQSKVHPIRRLVSQNQLTQESALKLVESWQEAKSRALGPQHQIHTLDGVLTGPMHRAWLGQAKAFMDDNKHCVFHLKSLTIQSLEVGSRADGAIITAVVDEAREFYNTETNAVIMRSSDASVVQYRAVRSDGTWKLQTFEFR